MYRQRGALHLRLLLPSQRDRIPHNGRRFSRARSTWETPATLQRDAVWQRALETFTRYDVPHAKQPVDALVVHDAPDATPLASSARFRTILANVQQILKLLQSLAEDLQLRGDTQHSQEDATPSLDQTFHTVVGNDTTDNTVTAGQQISPLFHDLRRQLQDLFRLPELAHSTAADPNCPKKKARQACAHVILYSTPSFRQWLHYVNRYSFVLPLKLVAETVIITTLLCPPGTSSCQREVLSVYAERALTSILRWNRVPTGTGCVSVRGCDPSYNDTKNDEVPLTGIMTVTKGLAVDPSSLHVIQPLWMALLNTLMGPRALLSAGEPGIGSPAARIEVLKTLHYLMHHPDSSAGDPAQTSPVSSCLIALFNDYAAYQSMCGGLVAHSGFIWDRATPRELLTALYLTAFLVAPSAPLWDAAVRTLLERLDDCHQFFGIPHALYVASSHIRTTGCRLTNLECRDAFMFFATRHFATNLVALCPPRLLKRLETITTLTLPHTLPAEHMITALSLYSSLGLRNASIRQRLIETMHRGRFTHLPPAAFIDLLHHFRFFYIHQTNRSHEFVFPYIDEQQGRFTRFQKLQIIALLPQHMTSAHRHHHQVLESLIRSALQPDNTSNPLSSTDKEPQLEWVAALDALQALYHLPQRCRISQCSFRIATAIAFQTLGIPLSVPDLGLQRPFASQSDDAGVITPCSPLPITRLPVSKLAFLLRALARSYGSDYQLASVLRALQYMCRLLLHFGGALSNGTSQHTTHGGLSRIPLRDAEITDYVIAVRTILALSARIPPAAHLHELHRLGDHARTVLVHHKRALPDQEYTLFCQSVERLARLAGSSKPRLSGTCNRNGVLL